MRSTTHCYTSCAIYHVILYLIKISKNTDNGVTTDLRGLFEKNSFLFIMNLLDKGFDKLRILLQNIVGKTIHWSILINSKLHRYYQFKQFILKILYFLIKTDNR